MEVPKAKSDARADRRTRAVNVVSADWGGRNEIEEGAAGDLALGRCELD